MVERLLIKNDLMLWALCVAFIGMPIADFLSIYFHVNEFVFSKFSLLFRGGMTLLLTVLLVVYRKPNLKEVALISVFCFPLFFSVVWEQLGRYENKNMFYNAVLMAKLLTVFIYYFALKQVVDVKKKELLNKLVLISLIVYFIMSIVGVIFSIEMFRSYPISSGRSGYKGIVWAQNEASALFLTGILIGFLNIIKKNISINSFLFLCLGVFAAFLLGTKASVIGIIFCFAVYLFSKMSFKKASFSIIVCVVALTTLSIFLYILYEPFQEAVISSVSYFNVQFFKYNNESFLSLLLSNRDQKLDFMYSEILPLNYLYAIFGGYPISAYMSEMDFPDLFLFLGFPVFLLYLFIFAKIALNNKNYIYSRFKILSFMLIIFISNTSGHFVISGVAMPYVAYLFFSMEKEYVS